MTLMAAQPASPLFDCDPVCPYDNERGWQAPPSNGKGKGLSRLGSLLQNWLVSAKRLFHMMIGVAFMLLTLAGASLTFAEWQGYRKTPEGGLVHFTMFGAFTIFLAVLCLYSFVKARNVR
jgi:hypothetical protein